MSQQIDRHKTKRNFPSGATKRQEAAVKKKKMDKVLAETRLMSDFVIVKNDSPSIENVRPNLDQASVSSENEPSIEQIKNDEENVSNFSYF